jgi:phosphoribosylaminoimidazole-succinocarboxamide synthase
MTSLTFDTLKYANRLKTAGIPSEQAEAQAQVLSEAFAAQAQAFESSIKAAVDHERASLENTLLRIESKLDKRFAEVDTRFAETKGEIALLKWMLGLVVAGVVALVVKAFLHV